MATAGGDRFEGLLRDWLAGAGAAIWVAAILGALFTTVAGALLVARAVLGLPLWSPGAAMLAAGVTAVVGPVLLARLDRNGP